MPLGRVPVSLVLGPLLTGLTVVYCTVFTLDLVTLTVHTPTDHHTRLGLSFAAPILATWAVPVIRNLLASAEHQLSKIAMADEIVTKPMWKT